MWKLVPLLGVLYACLMSPAEASYRGKHHVSHHHYGRYLVARHYHHWRVAHRFKHFHRAKNHLAYRSHSDKPSCFYVAASMGGPCGCWAAWKILHVVDHVWHGYNLWLANDWLRFPHVAPNQALAAVWPGRHVAPVVPGSYRDGTVVVEDSWATHRVRVAGLVFVQPPVRRPGLVRYAGAVPL